LPAKPDADRVLTGTVRPGSPALARPLREPTQKYRLIHRPSR
jgi:hypothetical protein